MPKWLLQIPDYWKHGNVRLQGKSPTTLLLQQRALITLCDALNQRTAHVDVRAIAILWSYGSSGGYYAPRASGSFVSGFSSFIRRGHRPKLRNELKII